jgi:hypothetical protein
MTAAPPRHERLDSWKAIADYLGRDVATVRRWEKGIGLPVHRVAGTGRSVFAYTSEIDAWLRASKTAEGPAQPVVGVATAIGPRRRMWVSGGLGLMILALIAAGLVARGRSVLPADLRVAHTDAGVIARDAAGAEQWRYTFPATHIATPSLDPALITGGADPGVFFAVSYMGRRLEDRIEAGALMRLDLLGNLQRSFSFDDTVTFGGKPFTGPWAIQSFAVDESTTPNQIAVAAHHYTWDPGIVTVLDADWRRRGTFVHAGWIESVRWIAADRLVIGGFSNAHDGGMVTLLDSNALDGQGPEPAGSRHHCDSCGKAGPVAMVVFPRSELNYLTASPFNRVLLRTGDGPISVRTIEVPAERGDADALYELTPSFEIVSARFSERYWEKHRALEAEGKLTHTREQCPDRDGPRQVKVWGPSTGWRMQPLR